jgi:hypothetical protein
MAGLLEPYIPDVGKWQQSALQSYALGDTMRNRNLLTEAGGMMAKGHLKGARDTLYAGGNLDEGGKIDARLRADAQAAKTEQLEKAAKFQGTLSNLAMLADTPEKWTRAIQTAQKMGLDVSKYADFGARDVVLAQSGKVADMLKMELERRKAEGDNLKVVGKGGRVFDTAKGQYVGEPEGVEADPELTLEKGKFEQGLRKEYTSLTGDLRTIVDSHKRMQSAAKLDSGAGDMAIVYGYMKMLDPTSVVREGEYATAENTGGVGEKIYGLYNRIRSGERLTPAQRAEFLNAAGEIAKDKGERFSKTRTQFEGIAKSSGADPARIMLDEGISGNTPPADGGGGAAFPAGAVELLRKDPSPEAQREFDETFGAGASKRALGK